MLKIILFRPTVKDMITPCTTKLLSEKIFIFFHFSIRNENANPVNKRKVIFNTDYHIFRKESNLPSGTLLSLSSYCDVE